MRHLSAKSQNVQYHCSYWLSLVTSASIAAAPIASHTGHQYRSRFSAVPSKSTVYTKPPNSLSHASDTAESKRRRELFSIQSGGDSAEALSCRSRRDHSIQ